MTDLTLEFIIGLSDREAFVFSEKMISGYFKNTILRENMYTYAIGESPICLVAHTDTVRKENAKIELCHSNGHIFNKHGVLGADDRAGVFMIFELLAACTLNNIPLPSVLITNFEEYRQIGVYNFIMDKVLIKSHWINTTRLFLGLDRRGENDYVTYGNYVPNEIHGILQSVGFELAESTSVSDIKWLGKYYLTPSVNVSVGYINEHTPKERLICDYYSNTYVKILTLLKNYPLI